MKRFIYLLAAAAALIAGGCTHNDGDIGPLFGSWLVEDMTLDGERVAAGEEHGYVQFQGAVVMCKLIDDRHSLLFYSVGSYEREGDALLLNFTHSDNTTAPGELQYSAPQWLLLTPNAVNRMEILALDNKKMKLKHITPDGYIVEYSFRKTH
ncbi:MAG: lipocalin-like domain-containing protein [Muribaculaceae bacterium]|nr:lipocalin-like domain-containing protein [Muribaculaceae bacterium]